MDASTLLAHPALADLTPAEQRIAIRIATSFAIEDLAPTDPNLFEIRATLVAQRRSTSAHNTVAPPAHD